MVVMDLKLRLEHGIRVILGASPPLSSSDRTSSVKETFAAIRERGHLLPAEEEDLLGIFREYLAQREALLEVIWEMDSLSRPHSNLATDRERLHAFILSYTASALLVRASRWVIDGLAACPPARERVDRGVKEYSIPRRAATRVHRSLTRPYHLWRLHRATQIADENRSQIDQLEDDPLMGEVFLLLSKTESHVQAMLSKAIQSRLEYRRQRLVSRLRHAILFCTFTFLEVGGRSLSNLKVRWRRKRVLPSVKKRIGVLLEPGDVVVTRHSQAASNLFLPGWWPHASLHLGDDRQRRLLGIEVPPSPQVGVGQEVRFLEARKDGVWARPIEDTLEVDAVAVIRPKLSDDDLRRMIERALQHHGKEYDFSFDFSRGDRLVCTEVVWRSIEGLGEIEMPLKTRAGRPNLSAEDLLDAAVDGVYFEVIAVYGAPGCRFSIAEGERARRLLSASYRPG